jgi:hypothetical protein
VFVSISNCLLKVYMLMKGLKRIAPHFIGGLNFQIPEQVRNTYPLHCKWVNLITHHYFAIYFYFCRGVGTISKLLIL